MRCPFTFTNTFTALEFFVMGFRDKLNWYALLLLVPSLVLSALFMKLLSANPGSIVLTILLIIPSATALISLVWFFLDEVIDVFLAFAYTFSLFFGGVKRISSTLCLALAGGAIYFALRMPEQLYAILLFVAAALFIVLAFILSWTGALAAVGIGATLLIVSNSRNPNVIIGGIILMAVILCIVFSIAWKKRR